MRFLNELEGWTGAVPAALVVPVASPQKRRTLLRRFAAGALRVPVDAVEIAHGEGMPPRLVEPAGSTHHLSSASRGGLAALSVASCPVGVDIEQVEPTLDPPLNVLHPGEVEHLLSLSVHDRPRAFARLWTCKEAYLKALGLGFSREPASFQVEFSDEANATIRDPHSELRVATACSAWRVWGSGLFVVSTVLAGTG